MLFDDTVYVMEIMWQFHLEILLQWMKCFVTWLEETDVISNLIGEPISAWFLLSG